MQSAFHNLNIYTPWMHLSSQSTNINKSIKTGYQPCLLCYLTANFARTVRERFSVFALFLREISKDKLGHAKTHIFENMLDCAVFFSIPTHTHAHTQAKKDTLVLPLIASVPSSHSQRATNTNQIIASHLRVPCHRYSN